jgi:hypothetical protein
MSRVPRQALLFLPMCTSVTEERESRARHMRRRAARLIERADHEDRIAGSNGSVAWSEEHSVRSIGPGPLLSVAEKIERASRLRRGFLPEALLGEPAWDMLLHLFIADQRKELVSATRLCVAAATAPGTAMRWISLLIEEGLVEGTHHGCRDGEAIYQHLSVRGDRAVRDCLRVVPPCS